MNFSEILLAIPIEVEHNFFIEKKMEGNVFLVRKAKDNSEKSLKMSFLLQEINKTEKIPLQIGKGEESQRNSEKKGRKKLCSSST